MTKTMQKSAYDVCVVGLGYIGLPTALVLSSEGLKVHGVDINPETVTKLMSGELTISEPGLQDLLTTGLDTKRFTATMEAVHARNFIISVPTPLTADKHADLSFVYDAAQSLIPVLAGSDLIVIESTCPPGTTNQVAKLVAEQRPDLTLSPGQSNSLYVAYCPERVIPGSTLKELRSNSRVIGGINEESSLRAQALYETFCDGELVITEATTAELTKLAENSFRDTNIAFANELSDVSHELGIDVWEVIRLANRHPRVQILNPGPGVGGHCIAVDPWFIHEAAPEQSRIIKASRELNDARPKNLVQQIIAELSSNKEVSICALGLSFKANVDDLRGSPAVAVVKALAQSLPMATIDAIEPFIDELPNNLGLPTNVELVPIPDDLNEYDVIVVLTDHDQFRVLNAPSSIGTRVFDTRGLWKSQ